MSPSNQYRQKLERLKGQRIQILKDIDTNTKALTQNEQESEYIQEAHQILQAVAQATQRKLEYKVGELVTLAQAAVFPDPYDFHLDFELKRGRSEAVPSFSKNGGPKFNPMLASGGGPVDVGSFALRMSLWSLQRGKGRPVLILDEPFRFVSRNLREKASHMIKEVSEMLGIQIIMVTHEPNLVECADRVFNVQQDSDGVSHVEVE